MVFIVGRLIEGQQWELCGVYDNEADAVARCEDVRYFVGPFERNHWIEGTKPWHGAYFPRANKPSQ